MSHAAREHHERNQHALLQEEGLIQDERGAEQSKYYRGPGNDDPLDWKLKIKERDDRRRTEIGNQRVKVQTAVARNVFFVLRQLRVHEIQYQRQRKNRVHARAPKFAWLPCRKVSEEDARERGHQGDVGLIPELRNLAENAVFEKDEAEHRPTHGDTERLQFVPKQQRDDDRSGPGIYVVQVELAPPFGMRISRESA